MYRVVRFVCPLGAVDRLLYPHGICYVHSWVRLDGTSMALASLYPLSMTIPNLVGLYSHRPTSRRVHLREVL